MTYNLGTLLCVYCTSIKSAQHQMSTLETVFKATLTFISQGPK